jgi:hypothetical protein
MFRHLAPGLGTLAATLALLAAIGTAGTVDHTIKNQRTNRAQLSEWYCVHKGTRCGGPSSSAMEDAWNQRELGYQIALGVVATAGGFLILAARSRRDSRT